MPLYNPTNALGITTATSLALGGATIGTDALAVTGSVSISGNINANGNFIKFVGAALAQDGGGNLASTNTANNAYLPFAALGLKLGANRSTFITCPSDPVIQFGAADVDTAPVAQTCRSQGALAGGTSNVAGADWTRIASPGKGTGAGGKHIWQTALAGSTGTAVNAATNALVLSGQTLNVCANTATPAAGAAAAVLLFGTTAGFGIYYGSGAPTVTAGQGSIYLRSDGSSTSTRLYINTTGSTTWTNVTTAA